MPSTQHRNNNNYEYNRNSYFFLLCLFVSFFYLPQPNEQQISVYYVAVAVIIIKSYCGMPMTHTRSVTLLKWLDVWVILVVVVAGWCFYFLLCECERNMKNKQKRSYLE